MFDLSPSLFEQLRSSVRAEEEAGGGDVFVTIVLGLVLVFFAWLVVAVIRKKLSSAAGRIGEFKEDEIEAARTARLWAEAKRRAEEEEEEEEEEKEPASGPAVDLQQELIERARKRREEHRTVDEAARLVRQEALRGEVEPAEPKPRAEVEPDRGPEPGPAPATEPEAAPEAAAESTPEPAPTPVIEREEESSKSLADGLTKTRSGFVKKLTGMFGRKTLDEDELDEIEEILFTADIGVRAAQKLTNFLQREISRKERSDSAKVLAALKDKIRSMLTVEAESVNIDAHKPFVILVVGVNGTGKTTTIGKLALKYVQAGKRVILAAADTFRAAAVEQLQIWGKRAGAQVVRGQEGGDPGAVVFDAISAATSQGADVVIADTAGRLHTKVNLIEELRKVHRVCGKATQAAPHEVWLVLDATTGQNAINQAKQFHKALEVSGIVLTKLDGTAKGGVIIGITDNFGIPVRYIGIGERAGDLRPFDPDAFVTALFT